MENEDQKFYFALYQDVLENISIIREGISEINSLILENQFLTTKVRENVFYAFTGLEILVYRAVIYKRLDILKLAEEKLTVFKTLLLNVSAKRNNYEFVQILHCRIVALLDFIITRS